MNEISAFGTRNFFCVAIAEPRETFSRIWGSSYSSNRLAKKLGRKADDLKRARRIFVEKRYK